MNENWVVALSNLVAIYPLLISYGDTWTFLCLLNVSLASFISHLFECHKHGMPGNGLSPRTSYLLNRWDVAGCILFTARFVQIYVYTYGIDAWPLFINYRWTCMVMACIGFLCLRISEYDKYNPNLKETYIMFHVLWHVTIFQCIGYYMDNLF